MLRDDADVTIYWIVRESIILSSAPLSAHIDQHHLPLNVALNLTLSSCSTGACGVAAVGSSAVRLAVDCFLFLFFLECRESEGFRFLCWDLFRVTEILSYFFSLKLRPEAE